eukprot:gene11232-18859_t
MNLGKITRPVTVAKRVWRSKAFPPPTRMCTTPRNLATPDGKSPDPNRAIQQKKAQIAALQKQVEQLQEQEFEAVQLSTHGEEYQESEAVQFPTHGKEHQKQHEREQRLQQQTAEATEALIRTLEQTTEKEIEALKSCLHGVEQSVKQEAESTRALITALEHNMKQHVTDCIKSSEASSTPPTPKRCSNHAIPSNSSHISAQVVVVAHAHFQNSALAHK